MASLSLQATVQLIDKITAPMRGISSQAQRLSRQFGEMARESGELVGQRRLIDSFKQQREALRETSEATQHSRMRLEQLEQQMRDTANPSATLVRQFEAAGRESQRLEQRLTSQRQHLQQLRGRLSDAGISTNNLAEHERDLARQIERTNQQLAEQRRRMTEVRRLERQSQQMGDMRNKAAGLAVGGAAATYAGARFIQPGIDLETNLSRVQAVTRLDKNSPQYQALAEQAKELGATTSFTSADAAAGQTFLAMAGFTPEAIKASMPGMLDLALAGGMDLPQTSDIASNILSGMNLDPLKDMGRVSDVLSATFTRANVDIGMLGETLKYAAPGAEMLGVSLEQSAAMAGKLGDAGIQASMAGTAMRSIMSRLASGPAKTTAALDKLGVKTADANGNLREMPDILQELHEKTRRLGNTEQAEIFKAIGGEEAGGALKILVDQAGAGELQKLTAELENAQGEAAGLAKTMGDNTSGDWAAMTSAIDALRTSIFGANGGAIREFIQSITSMTQKLTELANANPALMAVLGKLFAMLAIGAVIIGGMGAVMLTILGPMALLRASLVTLGLPTSLTPLAMLSKAFGMVGGAVKALTLTLMANPILALVLALAVLAYTVYKNWDTLGPMFANLWGSIANGAQALWARVTAIWAGIKQGVINYANELWAGLGIRFNSGIGALIGIILAFSPVGLFIRAFAAVWSYLAGLSAKFRQYGANILDGLKSGIMSRANAVVDGIKNVAGRVKGAFTGLLGIRSPSRVFASYGGFMMQGLSGGVMTNAKRAVNAIKNVAGQVRGAGSEVISNYEPMQFDTRKSVLPQRINGGSMAMAGGMSGGNITININGATDPMAVANEVKRVLADEQRNQAARRRSRLSDID